VITTFSWPTSSFKNTGKWNRLPPALDWTHLSSVTSQSVYIVSVGILDRIFCWFCAYPPAYQLPVMTIVNTTYSCLSRAIPLRCPKWKLQINSNRRFDCCSRLKPIHYNRISGSYKINLKWKILKINCDAFFFKKQAASNRSQETPV